MTARPLVLILFLSSTALAGCGKTGLLEQPAPMFGAQAKADYEAQHRAQDAARARAQAARMPEAEQNANTPDPNALPLHEAPFAPPIPGRTDPAGPPTALPSPGQPSADQ